MTDILVGSAAPAPEAPAIVTWDAIDRGGEQKGLLSIHPDCIVLTTPAGRSAAMRLVDLANELARACLAEEGS
jgi:hypothetical protein